MTIHQVSKTFRIFVSSTFSDLKAERNALQDSVFSRLSELCRTHGCRFQAIDLRWGVSKEATLDQQTMRICLSEISRCQQVSPRPNFLLLLGNRYGWRPIPEQISAQEFEEIEQHVIEKEDKMLLGAWYRRNDNAVPPVYVLQSRTGEVEDFGVWEARIERPLRAIFLRAIAKIDLAMEERFKYVASATEQEIVAGALRAEGVPEHVFGFFRTIKSLPEGPSAKHFMDLDEQGNLDSEATERLEHLKDKLRDLLGQNIYEYEAEWTGSGVTTDHITQLCSDVYESLASIIRTEIMNLEAVDPLDAEIDAHRQFGKERAEHFIGRQDVLEKIQSRLPSTNNHPIIVHGVSGSGKTALMAKTSQSILEFGIRNSDFVVISRFIGATPGSLDIGNLLYSLCKQIYRVFNYEQQKQQRLAEVLEGDEEAKEKRDQINSEYEISLNIKKLPETFYSFLAKVPQEQQMVLFIDALDQLKQTDEIQYLSWLPWELPAQVKIIVSTVESNGAEGDYYRTLQKLSLAENLVRVGELLKHEGEELLDAWLGKANRKLQLSQREEVLSKFAVEGLPLYLKLVFGEAQCWKSYDPPMILSTEIPIIVTNMLIRLELEGNHGRVLTSHALGYLAASRYGLAEDELIELLSKDQEVMQDFLDRSPESPMVDRLPVVVWSRLYFDLKPFLVENIADNASLLSFYHNQLGEVVITRYLIGERKRSLHLQLSEFFSSQPHQFESDGRQIPNYRKVSELPYQQTRGEDWAGLEHTLTDLLFLEGKCQAGMAHDLMLDYVTALDELPECACDKQCENEREAKIAIYIKEIMDYASRWHAARESQSHDENRFSLTQPEDILAPTPPTSKRPWSDEEILADNNRILSNPTRMDRIRTFSNFVNLETHNLARYGHHPGFTIQQAYNFSAGGLVRTAGERALLSVPLDWCLLCRLPAYTASCKSHQVVFRFLEVHNSFVETVALSQDGQIAVSGSQDNILRVWNVRLGQCLRELIGHKGTVESVSLSADGRIAVSGSRDHSVRVWETETGRCLRILIGHTHAVYAVAVSANGKTVVSGGDEQFVLIWDVETGTCVHKMQGHELGVRAVVLSANGEIAVTTGFSETLMWEISTGHCTGQLQVKNPVVAITPDGKTAITLPQNNSLYYDNEGLQLWDLTKGSCLRKTEADCHECEALALSADGRIAVSGGKDRFLRLWDIVTGQCLRTLECPSAIEALAFSVDGRIVITGSPDGLRVWDLETGWTSYSKERFRSTVQTMALSGDGHIMVSGSHDGTFHVQEIETGRSLHRIQLSSSGEFLALALSCNGRIAVSGNYNMGWEEGKMDHTLRFWDVERCKDIFRIDNNSQYVNTVALSADGRIAVSGGWNKALQVWDVLTGECLRTLTRYFYRDDLQAVAVSPDGLIAFSAGSSRPIGMWNIHTGELIGKIGGRLLEVRAMVVSADGRTLVAHTNDEIHVWNVLTGECKGCMADSSGNYLAVSSNGKIVVSGGGDNSVKLMDVKTGGCFAILAHQNKVQSVATVRNLVAVGDNVGGVTVFEIKGMDVGVPVITITRWYDFGNHTWNKQVTALCEWCGNSFVPSPIVLDAIRRVSADLKKGEAPYFSLPYEAWDDSHLVSLCPSCHKQLKFNPFIVDNYHRFSS